MKSITTLLLCFATLFGTAFAADPQAELKAAFEAADKTRKNGPADVRLTNDIAFHVPASAIFIPGPEAIAILRAMGNTPAPDTLGMVFPQQKADWFAIARFVKSGYIKDDDAKSWNADDLLNNLREGTNAANEERRKRGIPEVEVVGWVEKPHYDASTHRLAWSASSRDKGAPAGSEQGVNYNTYLLGREGYLSMNFVTGLNSIEAEKPVARELLAAVEFDKGKTYTDFNSSTDHMAEYGLAALVGGVAAKKLGLLALIAAFAVKFAKLIGVAVIGLGAVLVKFFRGRRSEP